MYRKYAYVFRKYCVRFQFVELPLKDMINVWLYSQNTENYIL